MHPSFSKFWPLLLLLVPPACVQTEIISEVFQPQLRVTPATVVLQIGTSAQLDGLYTDDRSENQSHLIIWENRAPAIVDLSAVGKVTGIALGQAWVVATAPGGLADSVLVTVVFDQNVVARVDVLNAPTTLVSGASANLQARAYNADNQALSISSFSWSSADTSILQIDTNGKVTAKNAGTTTVRAEAAGVNSLPVSIQVLPLSGLSRSGQFSGNSGYSVKGTATLEQSGNSLRLLLQSDFMASNGPMLGVYLATTANGGLNSQNSIKLANLQANTGFQEYAVPAGVGLQDYNYAVIYCIPFNVRFGTAQLSN